MIKNSTEKDLNKNLKVLAIDPGYERLGVAVLEKVSGQNKFAEKLIFSECFKTSSKIDHTERLFLIGQKIEETVLKHKPEFLATEKLFFSNNAKTAMMVAEARGIILYIAKKYGLKIIELHPADIKIAITGSGRADKKAIYFMAKKLIEIPNVKMLDDEIDAICIGLTFFAQHRQK
ncbi:MAG: crossover junction endodeoxyribonuclease RuvC [Candidatus Pacebacteria bacterium]|nr:crossover junction endodeoxyribonuclease RuvC [Candidatus Paceibacterota bacterium]